MRILYLSGSYIPSRRASSVHVMRMCAALARAGHQVTLVSKRCPARQEPGVADDFLFYGVEPRFDLLKLPRPALRGGGLVFGWHRNRAMHASAPGTLLYCRDVAAACRGVALGRPVVFEAHQPPTNRTTRRLFRRLLTGSGPRRLVVISSALRAELDRLRLLGPGLDVVVAPDAAEPAAVPPGTAKTAGAAEPEGGLRIGYVGSLHPGKGADLLLRLAARLPEHRFRLTGGDESGVQRLSAASPPSNLRIEGFAPPAQVPAILAESDVLLMPYGRVVRGATRQSDLAPWMSPLKMFEYMAAGKPIVASDLPVLREILEDGRNALLVPVDELDAWEAALRRLARDADLRVRLGDAARADLEARHTWDLRAERVLDGI